jgi:hypothetical protein
MNVTSNRLDQFLPRFHYHEIHRVSIQASAARVFRAIHEVTPAELPAPVHFLFFLRSLPTRLLRRDQRGLNHSEPILKQIVEASFLLLLEELNSEVVLGTIGKFWQATSDDPSNRKPAKGAREFMEFNKPGFAKAVMNFQVIDKGDHVMARTGTRIQALDALVLSKFRVYGWLILPGSALIRVWWLKAIKRRAEKLDTLVFQG